jgi:flavin reductase (DIM6/NTAB) family NADH-FMN oxidoreductase RutF
MSEISDTDLRRTVGHFATGVTVVTVETDDGPHGMTVNSFASVSLDPPLVLFSADRDTNTHDYVAEVEHFTVNILTAEQEWLSNRFAGEHHDLDDPFEDVSLSRAETGAPVLEDTLAYVDCSLEYGYDGGDHTIYVGRVEDLAIDETDEAPLLFFKGEYDTIEA